MADIAGVRNFQSVSRRRSDEAKRVATHVHVRDRLLDLRHVASDTLVARATHFMMRVLLDCWCVRATRRIRTVTIEAQNVGRLP